MAQWGASGCAHERNSMCIRGPMCLTFSEVLSGERQEPRPSPSLTILPATRACSVSSIHSLLPIFLSTLSLPVFRISPQCLSRPRSPQLGEEALCEVAPLLCEGDLKAAEEAGLSYLVYSLKKKIKMLPVFDSQPLLFFFISMQEGNYALLKH